MFNDEFKNRLTAKPKRYIDRFINKVAPATSNIISNTLSGIKQGAETFNDQAQSFGAETKRVSRNLGDMGKNALFGIKQGQDTFSSQADDLGLLSERANRAVASYIQSEGEKINKDVEERGVLAALPTAMGENVREAAKGLGLLTINSSSSVLEGSIKTARFVAPSDSDIEDFFTNIDNDLDTFQKVMNSKVGPLKQDESVPLSSISRFGGEYVIPYAALELKVLSSLPQVVLKNQPRLASFLAGTASEVGLTATMLPAKNENLTTRDFVTELVIGIGAAKLGSLFVKSPEVISEMESRLLNTDWSSLTDNQAVDKMKEIIEFMGENPKVPGFVDFDAMGNDAKKAFQKAQKNINGDDVPLTKIEVEQKAIRDRQALKDLEAEKAGKIEGGKVEDRPDLFGGKQTDQNLFNSQANKAVSNDPENLIKEQFTNKIENQTRPDRLSSDGRTQYNDRSVGGIIKTERKKEATLLGMLRNDPPPETLKTIKAKAETNYVGKQVKVNGQSAVISGNSFGRPKYKIDGVEKTLKDGEFVEPISTYDDLLKQEFIDRGAVDTNLTKQDLEDIWDRYNNPKVDIPAPEAKTIEPTNVSPEPPAPKNSNTENYVGSSTGVILSPKAMQEIAKAMKGGAKKSFDEQIAAVEKKMKALEDTNKRKKYVVGPKTKAKTVSKNIKELNASTSGEYGRLRLELGRLRASRTRSENLFLNKDLRKVEELKEFFAYYDNAKKEAEGFYKNNLKGFLPEELGGTGETNLSTFKGQTKGFPEAEEAIQRYENNLTFKQDAEQDLPNIVADATARNNQSNKSIERTNGGVQRQVSNSEQTKADELKEKIQEAKGKAKSETVKKKIEKAGKNAKKEKGVDPAVMKEKDAKLPEGRKTSESRVKINETLPEDARAREDYQTRTNKDDVEKANKLIKEDPTAAMDIVMGKIKEDSQSQMAVAAMMIAKAKKEGNTSLLKKIYANISEQITKTAQELQSVKLLHESNPQYRFIAGVIKSRRGQFKMGTPAKSKELMPQYAEDIGKQIEKLKKLKKSIFNEALNNLLC